MPGIGRSAVPGRVRSEKDRRRYYALRTEGLSQAEAAGRVGIAVSTGQRWEYGDHQGSHNARPEADRRAIGASRLPDPKPYDKLSDWAKTALAPGGFPTFTEGILAWRAVPWQIKAAEVSIDAILDQTERHYGVANEPPGVGKSTTWTFAIPLWLLCGGGREDPGWGRALRFMLGHASKTISEHYIQRIARILDSPRPYYDKEQRVYADHVLAREFGRFRPMQSLGDVALWQNKQLMVAQLEDVDLADKEPTFQAASPKAEFVGERCEYASWDDLVTEKLSRTIDGVLALSNWFQKEAEQRIEPGGILWLVGQRISSIDLFRDRLNDMWVDDDGTIRPKYFHIVFPAHNEPTCDGDHRQWDAELDGDGCLLDSTRLPWRDILKVAQRPHYRTVFQQEDVDPTSSLVTKLMIDGGDAHETNPATGDIVPLTYPGCWDHDRGWGDFPARASNLVSYVTVDPSVSGNWVFEWWATAGVDSDRYLVWAHREKMQASDALDWDVSKAEFVGWMERIQSASVAANQPIRAWVIEGVSAFRHFFQYRHFARWCDRWPFVTVIPHETQRNKHDSLKGVEALIRPKYRSGRARLPRKKGDLRALTFTNALVRELTTWGSGNTDDTVMADWFGEANIEEIIRVGRRPMREFEIEANLPPYLMRRRAEVAVRRQA